MWFVTFDDEVVMAKISEVSNSRDYSLSCNKIKLTNERVIVSVWKAEEIINNSVSL